MKINNLREVNEQFKLQIYGLIFNVNDLILGTIKTPPGKFQDETMLSQENRLHFYELLKCEKTFS